MIVRFCEMIGTALQELLCAWCVDQGNYAGKVSQQWIPAQLPCTEGGMCLFQVQGWNIPQDAQHMPWVPCSISKISHLTLYFIHTMWNIHKTSSQHNPGLPQPPPDGSFAYWHFRGFLMSIRSRQWMMVSIREVVSGELLGFFQSNARLVQCNLCWNCPSWKDVLNCSVVGGK